MERYTREELQDSVEILNTSDRLDRFGNKMWSRDNIKWAISVQMFWDRIKLAALDLARRFRYSIDICVRWVWRSLNEGTFKQLVTGHWYGLG